MSEYLVPEPLPGYVQCRAPSIGLEGQPYKTDLTEEPRMFTMLERLVASISRTEREDGQALAEYGLLLALIAVACLAALTALGLAISGILGSITGSL